MPLSREERKLLHQKSKQPTLGVGKPDNQDGYEGDVSFRQIDGSGTVEYVKKSHEWVAVASSGEMPPVRIIGGTRGSVGAGVGITSHGDLAGLGDDNHVQYLLIDGSRAMTSTMIIGSDADGTDRTITWGHSTLKTIIGIDDSADAFVINTDAAFDGTLANNSLTIDSNHNVGIAGDLTLYGADITIGSDADGTDRSIVWGHSTLKTIMGIDDSADAFVINTDAAFDGTLANNSFSIDASHNVIIAGDVTVGDDLSLTSDGSIISMGDGGPFNITHSGDGATIEGLGALVVDSAGSTVTVDGHTGVTLQSTSSGDILLDSAADVVLDAAGGNFEFKDAGTAQLTLDVDGTAGDIIFNLEVNGDDLVFTQFDDTEVLRLKDEATVVIRSSYITDHAVNSKPTSNGRHFATGDADYQQNYSWIGLYDQISSSSEHDADYGDWGES